ncbi:MAG: response regulator [Phycisphaerales bacterium]
MTSSEPRGDGATKRLVLVVDDEAPIRRFLRASLGAHGYRVNEAATAREALVQAGMQPPDVILLDLALPDGDGIAVTRELRAWYTGPIIVLSARGQESDKVAALDAGADDYLTKPFGVPELAARIRVALRHAATAGSAEPVYECDADGRTLRIDLGRRLVSVGAMGDERDARLTPTEFRMLALLAKHAGKVLTHHFLLREIWGPTHVDDVQYLRVYAAQLRQKLEADPTLPQFLLTEPGVGYRLAEPRAK